LPVRIKEIEAAIAKAEAELSNPALYNGNADLFAKLTSEIEAGLIEKNTAEERWLELAIMVEELSA
jgi:ABC transport system ATP-binding/permease protein